jgi:opacity protein-like surface antigen
MNKFTTLLASALLVTTAFANAADMSGTYAVVEAGYAMPTDKDKTLNSGITDVNKLFPTVSDFSGSKKKPGVGIFAVGVGYKFDQNFRSDFTFNYLTNSTVKYSNTQTASVTQEITTPAINEGDADVVLSQTINHPVNLSVKSKTTIFSGMINGYYDITAFGDMFTPYVGAGIGLAKVNYKMSGSMSAGGISEDLGSLKTSGMTFAYQVGAGTLVKVSDGIDFKIGYRFVDNGKPKLKDADVAISKHNFRTHQIVAGLQFAL